MTLDGNLPFHNPPSRGPALGSKNATDVLQAINNGATVEKRAYRRFLAPLQQASHSHRAPQNAGSRRALDLASWKTRVLLLHRAKYGAHHGLADEAVAGESMDEMREGGTWDSGEKLD